MNAMQIAAIVFVFSPFLLLLYAMRRRARAQRAVLLHILSDRREHVGSVIVRVASGFMPGCAVTEHLDGLEREGLIARRAPAGIPLYRLPDVPTSVESLNAAIRELKRPYEAPRIVSERDFNGEW